MSIFIELNYVYYIIVLYFIFADELSAIHCYRVIDFRMYVDEPAISTNLNLFIYVKMEYIYESTNK